MAKKPQPDLEPQMEIGCKYTVQHTFTQAEFDEFARLSRDNNPIHVDPDFAAQTPFGRPVAHGMMLYGLICGLISHHFPKAVQLEQQLMFPAPTFAGEFVNINIEITDKNEDLISLQMVIFNENGIITCDGYAILQVSGRGS